MPLCQFEQLAFEQCATHAKCIRGIFLEWSFEESDFREIHLLPLCCGVILTHDSIVAPDWDLCRTLYLRNELQRRGKAQKNLDFSVRSFSVAPKFCPEPEFSESLFRFRKNVSGIFFLFQNSFFLTMVPFDLNSSFISSPIL